MVQGAGGMQDVTWQKVSGRASARGVPLCSPAASAGATSARVGRDCSSSASTTFRPVASATPATRTGRASSAACGRPASQHSRSHPLHACSRASTARSLDAVPRSCGSWGPLRPVLAGAIGSRARRAAAWVLEPGEKRKPGGQPRVSGRRHQAMRARVSRHRRDGRPRRLPRPRGGEMRGPA
jgi:hypothetical protein